MRSGGARRSRYPVAPTTRWSTRLVPPHAGPPGRQRGAAGTDSNEIGNPRNESSKGATAPTEASICAAALLRPPQAPAAPRALPCFGGPRTPGPLRTLRGVCSKYIAVGE